MQRRQGFPLRLGDFALKKKVQVRKCACASDKKPRSASNFACDDFSVYRKNSLYDLFGMLRVFRSVLGTINDAATDDGGDGAACEFPAFERRIAGFGAGIDTAIGPFSVRIDNGDIGN